MKPKNILIEARDGSQLIIEGDATIPSGVIRVTDPLGFLTQFELAAEASNGAVKPASKPAKPKLEKKMARGAHLTPEIRSRGGKLGAEALWRRVRAGEIEAPWKVAARRKRARRLKDSRPIITSPRGDTGAHGPRLGFLHLTLEDAERLKAAVLARDNALSPMQMAVVKRRLGIDQKPMMVKNIAAELHLRHHSDVSKIFFSAARVLGIKRVRR